MKRSSRPNHISAFINLLAEFLSTWRGFLATFLVLMAGIGIGAALRFDENFMFGFNIFLSVAAIVIGGIILVAGARSEAALHVKLDYLIEHSQATNKVIGLEHKDAREIEEERKRVETEAAVMIDEVLESSETLSRGDRPRSPAP
jgi:low affinity Fe/Cu permease